MQEWMIAMLVISVLLMLRDMAKTVLSGRRQIQEGRAFLSKRRIPRREKVEHYAASFRKLADSFYGMPYRKDYLSSGQVESIIRKCLRRMCAATVISGKSAGESQIAGNVPRAVKS